MTRELSNELNKPERSASMGTLLLNQGKISANDTERIIALQKQKDMRFGDAAKALGLISEEDIQEALLYQFDFPSLMGHENNFSKELVAAYQPFSSQVEALRAMRGQLMLRWVSDAHKTIALISPGRTEGRSYIAANLAIVFSQLGERTLLIDADLRHPRQHELFKLQSGYGLSDLLAGRENLKEVIRTTNFRDLSILPAGTTPPNPTELVSRGLKSCLQQLHAQFDVILIDTPSADQGMDAQIIASCCSGALLVAKQHQTRLDDLQFLNQALQSTGSQCVGAVMTSF
jgi:chain length determinant protein tyrosine kinase EpsG